MPLTVLYHDWDTSNFKQGIRFECVPTCVSEGTLLNITWIWLVYTQVVSQMTRMKNEELKAYTMPLGPWLFKAGIFFPKNLINVGKCYG